MNEVSPVLDTLPDSPAVQKLKEYARMSEGAFAENTMKGVQSDMGVWLAWCEDMGQSCGLPYAPETVALFVDQMAETRKPGTVRRYVTSFDHLHRALELTPPGATMPVKMAIRRMNRAKGTRQDQATPLRHEDVTRMVEAMPDDPASLLATQRDAALILLAYDTMARRSELCALNVEDIQPDPAGTDAGSAFIVRSKTDQEGEGAYVYVAPETMFFVRTWIEAANLQPGDPLFKPLGNSAKRNRLNDPDVSRIYKRRAQAVGIDPSRVSGHSTRVGATQDMVAASLNDTEIANAGRWKSPAMVAHYARELHVQSGAASKLAKLQGRAGE